MKNGSYILIGSGACLGLYSKYAANMPYLLLIGIILIMMGVFKLNRSLSNNKEKETLQVKEEKPKKDDEDKF